MTYNYLGSRRWKRLQSGASAQVIAGQVRPTVRAGVPDPISIFQRAIRWSLSRRSTPPQGRGKRQSLRSVTVFIYRIDWFLQEGNFIRQGNARNSSRRKGKKEPAALPTLRQGSF